MSQKTLPAVDLPVSEALSALLAAPAVRSALAFAEADRKATVRDQRELVLIESPTGHEEKRSERYARMLSEAGLEDVRSDAHHNVWGRIRGSGATGKSVLLEGHLDTVFSFGDVKGITEDSEGRLHCPGICDDTRALAANLSVIRAFRAAGLRPVHDILVAGTVCEEGLGALNGMKWLLEETAESEGIIASVSIDGQGADRFYANATGMADWEFVFRGPGGHAWTAYGTPSAIHAAGRAIAAMADLRLPEKPKTILTVSLIGGGQAIHAIAQQASVKVNVRSDSQAQLDALGARMEEICREAAARENARWGRGDITVESTLLMEVPAGTQDDRSRIIQMARAATEALGIAPAFMPGGCTNANRAIARGIPAVTLGRGGAEHGQHTLAEWFDPRGVWACEQKSILMMLMLAGLDGVSSPVPAPFLPGESA